MLRPALDRYERSLVRRGVVKQKDVMSLLRRELLDKIGNVDLADLHRADLVRRITEIEDSDRPGTAQDLRAKVAVFFGWAVVAAAFAVLFVAYGLQFSFGLFVKAIGDDTGWSRRDLSLPYAVYVALYSLLSSVSGRLTDRYGPRLVGLLVLSRRPEVPRS